MPAARPLPAASAAICTAAALWVSFGGVAFTDSSGAALHFGLLPSLTSLAVLVVAALAVVFVVRPSSSTLAPLWLSAVLVLPWLPLPLPVPVSAFIWTGPLKVWLWIAIALGLAGPRLLQWTRSSGFARWNSGTLSSPAASFFVAGCLSALVYAGAAVLDTPQHPGGDEPHYLVITESLLHDHDLQIENNHQQRDYLAYFGGNLRPDFLRRGKNGAIYSIHAPGLPVLVAPAFAIGGYPAVIIEIVTISAVGGALAWLIAWRVTNDRGASWFGWAAAALSAPFVLHASAVYPDAPAAVIVLLACLSIVDARSRTVPWLIGVGAALGALPWLHTRFAVLAAAAALAIALRIVGDRASTASRLAALGLIPALSAAGWFAFFWIIYGTPLPSAPYGPATNTDVANIVRGIPGLLVDQQYGAIANAPVLACALLGIGTLLTRERRRLGVDLVIVAAPYVFVIGCFLMWWGGYSAPARFLVPVTLLCSMPAAYWFSTRRTTAARVAGLFALYVSLAMTAAMVGVNDGVLSVNFRNGTSRLFEWLSPNVDLTTALPSLFQSAPLAMLWHAAIWVLVAALATAAALAVDTRWRGQDEGRTARTVLVFGLVAEIGATAAVSFVWQDTRALPARPDVSAWDVLRRYEPGSSQLALTYRPFARMGLRDLPAQLQLTRAVPGTDNQWTTMARLPPGTYEISGRVTDGRAGVVRMAMDSKGTRLVEWPVESLEPVWTRRFTLPVTIPALRVDFDTAARQTVHDISIKAVSLLARADRLPGNPNAERAMRYGPAVVYWVGGAAWVEDGGVWVKGGNAARFAVLPDRPGAARLFVRNGPVANEVTLDIGGTHQSISMTPGSEQLLALPQTADGVPIQLGVSTTSGFRPNAFDKENPDARFLGVWLETR